jgi:hypothetical protein
MHIILDNVTLGNIVIYSVYPSGDKVDELGALTM